jgi:CHAT domain-containing protein
LNIKPQSEVAMNVDTVYQILKHGSSQERMEFVENCPDNSFKESILPLVGSDQPGMVVVAMTQLLMVYCQGQNPEVGVILAHATHRYGLEIFESGQDPNLLKMTLSNIACQYVNALNLLGRSEEVIIFTDRYISYYESIAENENLPTLKSARINALIALGRIDEADQMMKDPKLRGNWANDIEVDRLKKKIDLLKSKIFDIEASVKNPEDLQDGGQLIDILKSAIGVSVEDEAQKKELLELAGKLDPANRIDPRNPEGFRQLSDLLKTGEDFITRGSSEESEWTIKGKIREASGIFMLSPPPSQKKIRQSLTVLESCLSWCRKNGLPEQENDALWGIYLCHSRLDEPSPAADTLINLKKNLENIRRHISDPLERGGAFSTYPYLFSALCEKLQAAGRTEDLLEAIEASKGRGIADILTAKSDHAVADANIYAAVKNMSAMVQQHNFHYITYYVDDEQTYSVLVSKDGEIHPMPPAVISKSAIREASQNVDPRTWGKPTNYDPGILVEDTSEVLSPLIAGLGNFLDQGIIEKGDHICYSADDSFNNVPLHYLKLNGSWIVDHVSVSKIQNAFHLEKILQKPELQPPVGSVSLIVPTIQDTEKGNWPQMRENLWKPVRLLNEHFPDGSTYENEEGTIRQLREQTRAHKILQFCTHGIFPGLSDAQNPFYKSGLVLSDGETLPDVNTVLQGRHEHLLTPDKIFDLNLKFTDCHVSVMACVSGLSREGIGGDALGLDWAFIQADAASLLSSHWYVSAELAAAFFERFYSHWITHGKSRALASRKAMLDLRSQNGKLGKPYCWAAFTLTGDWR